MAWTAFPTWAVGQVSLASDWNTYVANNMQYLYNTLYAGLWIAPSLGNSWVNYNASYSQAGYRLQGQQVFLRGALASGASGSSPFTLPAGYVPTLSTTFNGPVNAGLSYIIIANTGVVTITYSGGPAYVAIDGINFFIN